MIRRSFIDLSHGQVHVRQAGQVENPTMVLFHQSPSSSVMFEPLMLELAEDFHLIAPDMPGFGESAPITHVSIPIFAQIMDELLTELVIKETYLFGHHTGASLAVALAARDADRFQSLALCGPPLLTDAQKKSLPAMAIYEAEQSDGSHLTRMWAKFAKKEDGVSADIIHREIMLALKAGKSYVESYRAVADYDLDHDLRSLNCPVLVFAGENDSLRSYLDRTEAVLRNGKMHVAKGAGTYICEREPLHVATLLKHFFLENDEELGSQAREQS